ELATCDDLAAADAQSDRQALAECAVFPDPIPELECCSHCPRGIVTMRHGQSEDGHDRVADELLERPAVGLDDLRCDREITGHECADVFGVEAFPEAGRADSVSEEDRDQPAFFGHRPRSPSATALITPAWYARQGGRPRVPYRWTTTTSNVVAVGGNPVSNLAFTTARRFPSRATVVGISNSGLVMTRFTVADERSGLNCSSVTWLLKFCTAHSRPASRRIPSTLGRATLAAPPPAIAALIPVRGSTV